MGRFAVLAPAVVAMLAGCPSAQVNVCANGAICPGELACTEDPRSLCGAPDLVEACAGRSDFHPCESRSGGIGTCHEGLCKACTLDLAGCYSETWSLMTSGTENDLLAVWVAHDSDAYAFGRAGTALHYDGLSWQPIAELSALTTDNLVAVVGFDEPRELFVLAGNGTVFHFSNSWRELPPVPSTLPLATLAGRSRNEIVGVGIGEVWRFDGSSWTDLGPLPSPTPSLHAAWSGETGELYVVGEADNMQLTPATDGVVFRKTAAGWGEALFYSLGDTPLRAVWGSADDDVFVAGVSTNRPAAAAHYDGVGWSEIPVSHVSGSTIWGSGPNDVFVAGEAGIYHYDGTGVLNSSAWVRETPLAITAIAGSRAGNVLAVGPRGTILRYARPAE